MGLLFIFQFVSLLSAFNYSGKPLLILWEQHFQLGGWRVKSLCFIMIQPMSLNCCFDGVWRQRNPIWQKYGFCRVCTKTRNYGWCPCIFKRLIQEEQWSRGISVSLSVQDGLEEGCFTSQLLWAGKATALHTPLPGILKMDVSKLHWGSQIKGTKTKTWFQPSSKLLNLYMSFSNNVG